MFYVPIGVIFFLAFWFLLALLVALVQIGILQYVFESMGISRRYMLALLLFSLLGSYINIPIANLPGHHEELGRLVDFFGIQYVVPFMVNSPGTVLAVNVGGAVIPLLLSLYLIVKHDLYGKALVAVAIVTLLVLALYLWRQFARERRRVKNLIPASGVASAPCVLASGVASAPRVGSG